MTSAETLQRVREVRRARTAGSPDGSARYTVYLAVMLTLIVFVPLLRLVVLGLALPSTLAILQASAAPVVVDATVGLLLAGMMLLGRVRGPALLNPFLTIAVAGNDLPRRRTLRRPFLSSAVVLAAVMTGSALTVAAVLATAGNATGLSATVFVTGILLTSVLAGVAWLAGQRLSARRASLLAALLAALTIALSLIPGGLLVTPWGWAALLYPSSAAPAWPALVALLAIVVIAVLVVPRLLDNLRGPELLAQARRWQTVGVFGATGDLAGALAQLRATPHAGRTWGAVRAAPLPVLFFVRDLLGSLRTPARFTTAVAALIAAGFLLTVAFTVPSAVIWVPTIAGALLGYLALGVWSDGFRHAVEAAGGTPLYGFGDGRLFLLHASLPVLCVLVFAGIGAAVAVAVGTAPLGGLSAIGFLSFTITVRIFNAVKGQMPLALLAPVPTPFGDLSGLFIAYWQADALIITCTLGTAVTFAALSGPLWLAVLVPAGALMLYLTRRKLVGL